MKRRLRRQMLKALLVIGVGAALRPARAVDLDDTVRAANRSSHFPFGPVVPVRPVRAWNVVTQNGQTTDLAALLHGRVTALQLMFTGCSATCPIQGALFEQAQAKLARGSAMQLMSMSIAPLADTPAALKAWLHTFTAGPQWVAVRPRNEDLVEILKLLGEGGEARPPGPDPHNGQVYIINHRGELVYRLPSMPAAEQIVDTLRAVTMS